MFIMYIVRCKVPTIQYQAESHYLRPRTHKVIKRYLSVPFSNLDPSILDDLLIPGTTVLRFRVIAAGRVPNRNCWIRTRTYCTYYKIGAV